MTSGDSNTIQNHAAFIWSVADLLRGDYKQSEYGKVILPLTVLRRLDCVLEPTKQAVLDRAEQLAGRVTTTSTRSSRTWPASSSTTPPGSTSPR
ncbi:MAG: type I restriction-modification system subunit M N-terminal domain-containing protein [Nocardioides sp.]